MHRRHLLASIGMLVSGVALVVFLQQVDWRGLSTSLASVEPIWVVLAATLLLGEFVLRAIRWQVLLRPLGTQARVFDLWAAQVVGAAANTLFPLRAGEIAKPLVASERTGAPLASVVATAVMERVYDLLGLVSVLCVMVLVLPSSPDAQPELVANLKQYGGLLGLIGATAMAVFFLLATREHSARGIFTRIISVAPGPAHPMLLGLFDGFVAGLGNARDRRGLLQAGALSVGMWLNGAVAIWCLFQAFAMSLPFGAACFTAVAIALTVAIPQAPGFLGVFHVAMQQTMILWGQPQAAADGFAVIFWVVSFVPVTAIGVVAMGREGLNWSSLRSAQAAAEPGEE